MCEVNKFSSSQAYTCHNCAAEQFNDPELNHCVACHFPKLSGPESNQTASDKGKKDHDNVLVRLRFDQIKVGQQLCVRDRKSLLRIIRGDALVEPEVLEEKEKEPRCERDEGVPSEYKVDEEDDDNDDSSLSEDDDQTSSEGTILSEEPLKQSEWQYLRECTQPAADTKESLNYLPNPHLQPPDLKLAGCNVCVVGLEPIAVMSGKGSENKSSEEQPDACGIVKVQIIRFSTEPPYGFTNEGSEFYYLTPECLMKDPEASFRSLFKLFEKTKKESKDRTEGSAAMERIGLVGFVGYLDRAVATVNADNANAVPDPSNTEREVVLLKEELAALRTPGDLKNMTGDASKAPLTLQGDGICRVGNPLIS